MTYESGGWVQDFFSCPQATFHSAAKIEEMNPSSLLVLFRILFKGIFINKMVKEMAKSNTYKNVNKRKEDAIKLFFQENQITKNRLILDFLTRLFAVRT